MIQKRIRRAQRRCSCYAGRLPDSPSCQLIWLHCISTRNSFKGSSRLCRNLHYFVLFRICLRRKFLLLIHSVTPLLVAEIVETEMVIYYRSLKLVKECNMTITRDDISPRKSGESLVSNVESPRECRSSEHEDQIKEIRGFRSKVKILEEREGLLEIQLLEYYGLKKSKKLLLWSFRIR